MLGTYASLAIDCLGLYLWSIFNDAGSAATVDAAATASAIVSTNGPSEQSAVHIWSAGSLECRAVLTGFHKSGIALLAFSPTDSSIIAR